MGTKYHRVETGDDSELVDRNTNSSDDIELRESVPPAYSNESNDVEINDAPALLTEAELRKRLPPIDGSNADVRAFIQLLLQRRGESYHLGSDDMSLVASASGMDIRYLTGADLHTLKEEELVGMFPETWPPALQKLVAKDVKWFTDWDKRRYGSVCGGLFCILFVIIFIFAIVTFVRMLTSHRP